MEFCLLAISAPNGGLKRDQRAQLTDYLNQRLRITDHIGQLDETSLAVILSATSREGSSSVTNDILKASEGIQLIIDTYCYPDDLWFDPDEAPANAAVKKDFAPKIPSAGLFTRSLPMSKRWMDILLSVISLAALMPLMLMLAMCVKLSSPGPVFFSQLRNGTGGRPFRMFKFRTMLIDAEYLRDDLNEHSIQDGPAFKMDNDPRVTRIGRVLRAMSLDELPQLWHVLRGDMSIVGPRPLPCEETNGCEEWQLERLDVTPGLTCTWQIDGSQVPFAEWMRMDIRYLRGYSLLRDLRLVIRTAHTVLIRRDGK